MATISHRIRFRPLKNVSLEVYDSIKKATGFLGSKEKDRNMLNYVSDAPHVVIRIISCFASLLFTTAGFAAPFSNSWKLSDLINTDQPYVVFVGVDGKIAYQMPVEQAKLIISIKKAVGEAAELVPKLIIVDGQVANAFAGKDDKGRDMIGLNFAMLDILKNDAHMVAGIIGHEVAHLKLRHGEKRQMTKLKTGVLEVVGGAVLQQMGVSNAKNWARLGFFAIQSKYSRDNERESDYLGVIWAVQTGFEPEGAVRLHNELAKQSNNTSSFLASHPSSAERIKTLRALSRRLSGYTD